MTENHKYGPDLKDLNAGVPEDGADEAAPDSASLQDSPRVRSKFFESLRQDVPPDDSELSRFADLEAEHNLNPDFD